MIVLSVVSPVYKAEKIIEELIQRIESSLKAITDQFEIILVEDGSPDNSWSEIEKICKINPKVKGIKLSRNFGQHYAITAGIDHSKGEWVVVMDCDLQDQPEEISKLYNKALEGYDIVLARRVNRQDRLYKRVYSWLFYKVLSYLTGVTHDPSVANFGIYHRKVIQAVCSMRESIRIFPIMVRWVGFTSTKLDVAHASRTVGKSTYTFNKMLHLALDIILAYSDKPIRVAIKFGLFIAILSFLFAILFLYQYIAGIITVPGYASLIISIWFFSGILIAIIGIVGLYVGKTFEGVKKRPIYVVKTKLNNE